MKRLMIIDFLNLYLRNYLVNPTLSTDGRPAGGIVGTLRSIQKLSKQIKPDQIIICHDGPGGARKKKSIITNYKEGRKPIRLNRNIKILDEHQELENKIWQQTRLVEYLNNFPIMQFLEPDIEADDLISFVAQHHGYSEWNKIIVSSDKDFIQLCDHNTLLFRPIQEQVLTWKSVVEEYGIHPTNFAIARSMAGDKSDNIPGIPGVGLKTVKKCLPFLAESKTYLFDDIESFCLQKIEEGTKIKFYQNIVDNMAVIKNNYRGMQLYSPNISVQVAQKTRNTINDFIFELNLTETQKMLLQDGIAQTNFEDLYSVFRRIVVENK